MTIFLVFISMEKLISSKKMFVFDLDNTLYDVNSITNSIMETKEYKQRMINFMEKLQNQKKIIVMCTYNLFPMYVLRKRRLELVKFFNYENILYPKTISGFIFYKNKSEMILEYAKKYPGISPSDIILFDDRDDNIKDVQKVGITGILVDTRRGIFSNHI